MDIGFNYTWIMAIIQGTFLGTWVRTRVWTGIMERLLRNLVKELFTPAKFKWLGFHLMPLKLLSKIDFMEFQFQSPVKNQYFNDMNLMNRVIEWSEKVVTKFKDECQVLVIKIKLIGLNHILKVYLGTPI